MAAASVKPLAKPSAKLNPKTVDAVCDSNLIIIKIILNTFKIYFDI